MKDRKGKQREREKYNSELRSVNRAPATKISSRGVSSGPSDRRARRIATDPDAQGHAGHAICERIYRSPSDMRGLITNCVRIAGGRAPRARILRGRAATSLPPFLSGCQSRRYSGTQLIARTNYARGQCYRESREAPMGHDATTRSRALIPLLRAL